MAKTPEEILAEQAAIEDGATEVENLSTEDITDAEDAISPPTPTTTPTAGKRRSSSKTTPSTPWSQKARRSPTKASTPTGTTVAKPRSNAFIANFAAFSGNSVIIEVTTLPTSNEARMNG